MTLPFRLTRRATLLGLGAVSLGRVRMALAAAPTDQRFAVVLLRGALDGMAAVPPHGDPGLAALRGPLVPAGMLDLGGFYGLHPALASLHAMYAAGEALAVHAIAGPYRTRSHFEAQDLLQLGTETTSLSSGWLNRLLAELPASRGPVSKGLAVGLGTPLLLQGPAPVGAYAPAGFAAAPGTFYQHALALAAPDPLLGPALARGLRETAFDASVTAAAEGADDGAAPGQNNGQKDAQKGIRKKRGGYAFPALAAEAGRLLATPDGPRIAAFELEGWDTHVSQTALLAGPLANLDLGLAALKASLGPAWGSTVVLVATEFGRTARMNGTRGTDHGTATAAFLLGGRVAGGRVRATWPGLGPGKLFENRDLAPTADIRALAKGALAAQFGLGDAALGRIFPASAAAAPMAGLLRA